MLGGGTDREQSWEHGAGHLGKFLESTEMDTALGGLGRRKKCGRVAASLNSVFT